MSTPQVSVVLPFYNAADTVAEAIDSVLAQRDVNFELILIDDGSTDDSLAVATRRADDDPRVLTISHDNRGLAASLNVGLDVATAPIVARMDADDVALPGRLRTQVEYLDAHPSTVLVGGQIDRLVGGEVESRSSLPLRHDDIVRALLDGRHALCHPTVAFRRGTALAVGGYWAHGVAEDWDFYLKLAERGDVANVADTVLEYRFHDGGINADSMAAVRTNIAFAVENHRRRTSDRSELTRAEFVASLSTPARWRIAAQTRSLTAYRRSLQRSGVAAAAQLGVAAAAWPPFAAARLRPRATR